MNPKMLKRSLKEAERELDAAKRRSEVDLAAARYLRLKAELKRLETAAAG